MSDLSAAVETTPAPAQAPVEDVRLGRAARRDRAVVAALWLAMLVQALIFALIQPVWSRVDEAQHYHYVQYMVENKGFPIEGQTFLSPEVLDVSLASRQWGWRPAGALSTPANLDQAEWIPVPAELDANEREKWVRRNLWRFNYEAMQPPLYYALNAPLYQALPDSPWVKLYGMRLLAALMASAIVPITYLLARETFPDSRLVLYGAPASALLIQGYALNMSQMTNDALAVPLAAAAVLVLLRMIGRGLTWKGSALAGAIIGASLLSKMTTVFLLPLALLPPAMLVAYGRERAGRALVHGGIILGLAALIMAPWFAHNLQAYGDISGASAARPLMSSFFWSPAIDPRTLRLPELLPTFWFGEPIYPFHFWKHASIVLLPVMLAGVAGVGYYMLGRDRRQVPDVQMKIVFVLLAFVIGLAINLAIPFASGIGGVPGRYLYPLIPPFAFLLIFGIDRLFRRERARFVVELALVWLIVFEALNLLSYVKNL